MRLKGIILLGFVIWLFLNERAEGQTIPWSFTITGTSHNIIILPDSPILVDGESVQKGDVIGVFFETENKTLQCAGYAAVDTGAIDLTAYGEVDNNPGFKDGELLKYKIWRKSSGCITDSVLIDYKNQDLASARFTPNGVSEVISVNGISLLKEEFYTIQTTKATCLVGGKLLLKSQIGKIDTSKVKLSVRDSYGRSFNVNSLYEAVDLPAGIYQASIYSNGCSLLFLNEYSIIEDPNCKYPIISPGIEGSEDYFIPFSGRAKIYDRNGVLKAELEVPGTFDGTDRSGNPLPMGTYVITCKGEKDILLTIIR